METHHATGVAAPLDRVEALRDKWKRQIRRLPPAERLQWLRSPEAVIAFSDAPQTRQDLLRSLTRLQDELLIQSCSEPWFRDVWHYGALYAPNRPCCCDHCRLRRLWPDGYVATRGVSFECHAEGRARKWYLLPSSPSGRAIEALGQLTMIDPRTGAVRRGGRLLSPVHMLPESEAALKREIAYYLATGHLAPNRSHVNIEPPAPPEEKEPGMKSPLSMRLKRALELERCGMTPEQAATLLGVTPSAMRMRLKRARAASAVGQKRIRSIPLHPAPLGDVHNI